MLQRTISKAVSLKSVRNALADGVSSGSGGSELDAAVTDWVSRVVAAGSSVSVDCQNAANTFVLAAQANGYWNAINRINLFAGDDLTACLIPLLVGDGGASDVNTNFVSGDYSESAGLTTAVNTKYLDTGLTPAELGKDDNFFAVYCRSVDTSAVRAYFGVGVNGADAFNAGSVSGGASTFARNSTSASTNAAGTPVVTGIVGTRRSSSTSFDALSNDNIVNSVTASNSTASSLGIRIFGRNDGSGAGLIGSLAGYIGASYLDNTQYAALRTDWEAFQDTLGRGVL